MKEPLIDLFDEYRNSLSGEDAQRLTEFFTAFDSHCLMAAAEKKKLRRDFERALLYYRDAGLPLETALSRLDIRNLGGFYARPPVLWFALDDAAKIYPISMGHGQMSVFRLSAYLKRDVVPELLQMALSFTIKRFPSFATTLKKGFFWHYLDTAKRRFSIEPEADIPCRPLKVSHSGSQSFRVLWYKNRISVEYFHVLTDGTGGMVFLKALTTAYLRLTGVECAVDDPLLDINAVPAAEEFANAFAAVPASAGASGFVSPPAVQMDGRLSRQKPCRVLHFKMDAAQLKAVAAKYGATITAYLLALMFLAGKAATDELQGVSSIQVPVNMRRLHPSRTLRNFSMYCSIRLPLSDATDTTAILGEVSRQLQEKASPEAMADMLTATKKLVGTLKYVPLAIKQPVAKLVYGFLGDRIFTNTLSNLGVVTMPAAYAAEIESMDFVLGTAITNRASCAAVTFGNTATFSITKMTADPSFEEAMHRLLTADGVAVRVEGSELCEN